MTYNLCAFSEAPYLSRRVENNQGARIPLASFSLTSRNPLQTLRRVSGRLSRLFHSREHKVEVAPRRLLVVDDEESICFSMSEYFTHHGFSVETASEVEQAERMIKSGNYQVIIQDLRLGDTKNPGGLNMIRLAHEYSPDARIVVLTAYGSRDVETEAKASGADAFLRKPQPLSQVAQVVRGLIESPRRRADPPA